MKHVSTFTDRHGTERRRFRKAGRKTHYLKSEPGTPAFAEEYAACLEQRPEPKAGPPPLPMLSLVRQLKQAAAGIGYVYFIEAENGLIKIGYSASIRERMKKLNTAVPMQLTLLGLHEAEKAAEGQLHQRFAAQRVMGEWFAPSPELRQVATGTIVEQSLTVWTNP